MVGKCLLLATCAVSALVGGTAGAQEAARPGPLPSPQAQAAQRPDGKSTNFQTPTSATESSDGQQDAATQGGEVDGSSSGGSDRRVRVEERDIVVTGSRFNRVLAQPQSKSIISAEERNLAGVGNVRQLIQVQPGFNYTDAFGLNVRGVGRQTEQTLLGQENTVIQYVDGFINLVPSNIAESTLFGGNVQFIRGPGGTTYGRNSLAGSANLVSRSPTKDFTAQAVAGGGRAGYFDVGLNFAGPITEDLGFRVGFERIDTPTVQRNLGSAKDAGLATSTLYIEFQLEWRYRGFHIRTRNTTFSYDNQPFYPGRDRYSTGTPATATAAATRVFGGLAPNPQFGYAGPVPSGPNEINVDYVGYDRLRNNYQNITNADLDLGFGTLFYVGGYQQYRSSGSADLDQTSRSSYNPYAAGPTGFPIAPIFASGTIIPTDYRSNYLNDNDFWSQEVRLESKGDQPFRWLAGYYHFDQDFDEQYWENIPGATAVLASPQASATNTAAGALNPRLATYQQRNVYKIRSDAVFGNVTWDVSPHIRFDGGLRHTWDRKDALTNFRFVYYYPPAYAADVSPAVHGARTIRPDEGLSGRATLAYRWSDNNQVYASYQHGYQASALTLGQGLPPNNVAEPQKLDVYEIGGIVTKGPVRFDGSAFYQNLFDQQIPISTRSSVTTPTGTTLGPIFTRFTNAPLSRIYGAEAQLTWRPTVQSSIVASYTYLHSRFERFDGVIDITEPTTVNGSSNPVAGTPQDLAGNVLPRTPTHKATLYGYYGIPLGGVGSLIPGGSVSYQTGYYTSPFNVDRFRIDDRAIVGLTLTYRTPSENLDVTGTVTNLTRNRYVDNYTTEALGGGTPLLLRRYGADRFWSVIARYRF